MLVKNIFDKSIFKEEEMYSWKEIVTLIAGKIASPTQATIWRRNAWRAQRTFAWEAAEKTDEHEIENEILIARDATDPAEFEPHTKKKPTLHKSLSGPFMDLFSFTLWQRADECYRQARRQRPTTPRKPALAKSFFSTSARRVFIIDCQRISIKRNKI